MKRISQAGRDHLYGDQIMVPKLVTRSRKMWLSMPTAQRPQSARYEGESHLRQRQIASVRADSKTAQIGRQSTESVMLRCQVMINIGFSDMKSRRPSESE